MAFILIDAKPLEITSHEDPAGHVAASSLARPDRHVGGARGRPARGSLGFRDLWVTENTLDHVFSFDPGRADLRGRRHHEDPAGRGRVVLPVHNPTQVAHQVATLDYVSNGRAILGVGLGREHHYTEFQVPTERRVRRFREGVELIKALWTQPKVDYRGAIYQLEGGTMVRNRAEAASADLVRRRPPDALRRAATIADGWMGSGGSSTARFPEACPSCAELEKAGRDPATFPISKRVFISVHERADVARAELTAGSASCITIPTGPTPRASTARRSKCGSGWRSWSPSAPTTSCSTPCAATPSSWKRSPQRSGSPSEPHKYPPPAAAPPPPLSLHTTSHTLPTQPPKPGRLEPQDRRPNPRHTRQNHNLTATLIYLCSARRHTPPMTAARNAT